MATGRFLLGIVFLVVIGSSSLPFGNILKYRTVSSVCYSSFCNETAQFYRDNSPVSTFSSTPRKTDKKLISIAQAELGVREQTGKNDGKRIEEYQRYVGLKRGDPYCAAFISWVFKQAGYTVPRTGWSPALFPAAKLVKAAAPGNVFGIYFPSLKRIAHCGFVENVKGDWIGTIEANTNIAGSREGDGVYRRLRHKRFVYRYSNWQEKS